MARVYGYGVGMEVGIPCTDSRFCCPHTRSPARTARLSTILHISFLASSLPSVERWWHTSLPITATSRDAQGEMNEEGHHELSRVAMTTPTGDIMRRERVKRKGKGYTRAIYYSMLRGSQFPRRFNTYTKSYSTTVCVVGRVYVATRVTTHVCLACFTVDC